MVTRGNLCTELAPPVVVATICHVQRLKIIEIYMKMAGVNDNWQTKLPSIEERTRFIFNKELMSDVKFVFTEATDDGSKKAKLVIPAHKFVLAISSPVFYAMLYHYGPMAETGDSIELSDCDYESLLELFRHLYGDEANLSESNVMQVYYLAVKYMVPSLAAKCTDYMYDTVDGSNIFSILLHAQKFKEKQLEDRCWEVLATKASVAVNSHEFITLDRPVVESVVKKEKLFVGEVELFQAVDSWATKEIERKGLTLNGNIKRQVLGEEIVKAIRFPLMSQKEFASIVLDSNILTLKEVVDMMKYYSEVLTTRPPFPQVPRSGPFLRCFTFYPSSVPINLGWQSPDVFSSSPRNNTISFEANKSIFLHGLQIFGKEGSTYGVSELRVTGGYFNGVPSLFKQSEIFVSKTYKDRENSGDYFDVLFSQPVYVENGKRCHIISHITGPLAPKYYSSVSTPVECADVTFTFGGNKDEVAALIFSFQT